uniref:Ig-like domain-containing protein n=1 Tax=Cyprinus carpio carpio TaxID=630221 RepID=A0A9J7ZDP3_CYPCA
MMLYIILTCIFMSILMMVADGFTVHGPSGPLFAPLGSSVVLLCYVNELLVMEDLEVEWRRTDSGTLVHLYQDGESRPEVQQQDYHERAHFFTDQIQHGNFSLRLDNLRAEDEGRYTCRVYSQQGSGETVVQIKHECLLVSGSDRSVSAYDGEDVTLSCSVDSHITPEHIEEVLWRKTDEDILVLLFKNNKTLPDTSDERYRDRVELFTAEIPKGNFSLRLKSVRTEDKGVYMCHVFAGGLSANATAKLEQLGFSAWHITVLIFCFAATFGAVLLFCCLNYYRSKNTVTSSIIWNLQVSLVFCPNICMFFAFMLWGFTEGSLHETVTCCALYFLRPVMLIWALRYLKYLQDNLKSWIRIFRITREFAVFMVFVYSVLFTYVWRKRAHDTDTKPRIFSAVLFGIVVLSCLILSIVDVSRCPSQERPSGASPCNQTLGCRHKLFIFCLIISILSDCQLFQFIILFIPSEEIFVVVFVQPLLLICIPLLPHLQAKLKFLRHRWITLLWIITITLLDIILLIYVLLATLTREREYLEWTCVILFIEVLKMIVVFKENVQEAERSVVERRRQQTEMSQEGSNALSRCNEIMFMFGAVGLVLLNSVTLTAELILKARNGERVMKDLRVVVFPSECVFALYWLVLQMHAFWRSVTSGTQNHEMENLADPDVLQTQI